MKRREWTERLGGWKSAAAGGYLVPFQSTTINATFPEFHRRVISSRSRSTRLTLCRVRAVLRSVWRARSMVERVNSMARMQQARHWKMTLGLLDLKRLYWNLRRVRTGHRKGQTPYGLLGRNVPDLSFWEILKLAPEELRENQSALEDTP